MPVGCYIGRVKKMVEQRRAVRRVDGRRPAELRPVRLVPGFLPPAEGSVLIETGATRVICTATVQEGVPPFLRGQGRGWVTAEYGMLPRSSGERIERERRGPGGRTHEIQRLVGRSLRAVTVTGAGRYVELQGTAEGKPFTPAQLERLLKLAAEGLGALAAVQRETLAAAGVAMPRRS